MFKDRAIILLAIGETLAWATIYYTFPALILRWEQDLGWGKAELTAGITLAVLLSAVLSPFSGRLIDSGRGPVMMGASAMLGAVGLVLLAQVETLPGFYGAWAVLGVAMTGCLYEPCFALVTRARGDKAKGAIIVITLAAGFASTISFPAMHGLADTLGWRDGTLIFAAVVAFMAAPMLWYGTHLLEKEGAHLQMTQVDHAARRAFLKTPLFWLLAIGFALGAITHGATLHHLLPILDDRGVPDDAAIVAASFIGPMQVAGRLVMMAAGERGSNHGFAIVSFIMMAISVFVLLAAGAVTAFVIIYVILFGGAYGMVSILRPVIAREVLGGDNFGAKSGALALPYLVCSATAPYIGALIWSAGGYDLMLPLMGVLSLAGCALYVAARRLVRA